MIAISKVDAHDAQIADLRSETMASITLAAMERIGKAVRESENCDRFSSEMNSRALMENACSVQNVSFSRLRKNAEVIGCASIAQCV